MGGDSNLSVVHVRCVIYILEKLINVCDLGVCSSDLFYRNTAKTFYAASIFFEILNQFGVLQPDVSF